METIKNKKNLDPERFGIRCFGDKIMEKYLDPKVMMALKKTAENGSPLEVGVADAVAAAMRDWAIENGATHYTHWFQPMTGVTAEKHEAFLTPDGKGGSILEFSGKELIKGEPDASSFPSGGLRATFEARGYTAWDPMSYAFIKDNVLCIPTAFCSYGGEALDKKTPLLRSMDVLNTACLRMLKLFGMERKHVWSCVGEEQEYFLVDRETFSHRKDLIYTGRTLFGANPPKRQELSDHYYGTIPQRVASFMADLDEELWELGVPAHTEHNEAAPAQHELAPVYEKCTVAIDHNQLMMDRMKVIAEKHGLECLLHEKPFAGISGSGKHNNWSLSTDQNENLFNPNGDEKDRDRFLTFFLAFIAAVDKYQDLIRISVADAGNDHRLGGHEAPPAIVSISVGEELEDILKAVERNEIISPRASKNLKTGVRTLPPIPKDTSDRNRTAPVAFTGNKFEVRVLGASQSAADLNTVLNTAVANELNLMSKELEKVAAESFTEALHKLLAKMAQKHKRIIFNGNNYGEEWKAEATKLGLSNYISSAEAIPHLTDKENEKLFDENKVLTPTELKAIRDIKLEIYCKRLHIEAQVMVEMIRTDIIPAVIGFEKLILDTMEKKKVLEIDFKVERDLVKQLTGLNGKLHKSCEALAKELDKGEIGDPVKRAQYYGTIVLKRMNELRSIADELESMVGKKDWPFPSYGRLLNPM